MAESDSERLINRFLDRADALARETFVDLDTGSEGLEDHEAWVHGFAQGAHAAACMLAHIGELYERDDDLNLNVVDEPERLLVLLIGIVEEGMIESEVIRLVANRPGDWMGLIRDFDVD